jgi:hypothetical protein
MASWLDDTTANRYRKSYFKDFVDLSGNLTVRNGDFDISGGNALISGNVGIGTTNPEYIFDINRDLNEWYNDARIGNRWTNNAGTSYSGLIFENADYGGAIRGMNAYGTGGGLSFLTMAAGSLTERMRIANNGNVGIGTNNPGAKLHIMDGPICVERTFDPSNDNGEAGLVFKEKGYDNCFYMAYDAGGTAGTDNEHLTFYSSGSSGASPTAGTGNQVVRMFGNGNVRLNGFYGKVTSNNSEPSWADSNYGTAAMRWQCIGPNSANANNYWDLQMWRAGHFYFAYNNTHRGYVDNGGSNNRMNFTGQHRSYIEEIPFSEGEQYIGLIACANKNTYINVEEEPVYGKDAITINESLPIVSLCRKEKDKSCFGIISQVEDNNEEKREYSLGTFVSVFGKQQGDNRFYINSVGEGALWVSNKNGNLESGDYITTASVPGYGQKQDDDFLHNYTVAKITMDCDFNPQLKQKKRILRRVIDFTFDMSSNNYYDVSGNDTIYTKPTLDDNDKIDEYKNPHYTIVVDDSYNLIEARQNVLDANGEIQWEDTDEQERAYEIRHLDPSGNIITEQEYNTKIAASEEAYIAAFVGCTYHCG